LLISPWIPAGTGRCSTASRITASRDHRWWSQLQDLLVLVWSCFQLVILSSYILPREADHHVETRRRCMTRVGLSVFICEACQLLQEAHDDQ
jgi:hypothetical protein